MASSADFEGDLAQLANLSDEDLQTLETAIVAAFDAADQANDDAEVSTLADQLDQVRAEISKRSSAPEAAPVAAAAETEEEEPTDVSTDTAPAPDATPEPSTTPAAPEPGTETAVEPETPDATSTDTPEAPSADADSVEETEEETDDKKEGPSTVAAASGTVAVPRDRKPVVASGGTSTVVAGADIPGFPAGTVLTSGEEFGRAMANRINTLQRLSGGDGEQVIVASIRSEAPTERTLVFGSPEENMDKIRAITDPDAITAAGGCCAPLTTRYELFDCGGSSDRPVKDALVGFQADRGGIRYYAGPSLSDVNKGVGFWTCADDEQALVDPTDPANWKTCARIECPPEQTAEIQAVTLCLTFGVLQSRVFPELAVANNKLAMVAHARIAESALLAQIKAGSTAITDAGTAWGAVRDLLSAVSRAAMYLRDRHRVNDVALRAILPSWVLEALRSDIAAGPSYGTSLRDHFGASDADIEAFFRDRKINVTWALDTADPATNGGGYFAEVAAGALPAWPTTVQWALFIEGSWLYLDGGTLDLGVVRDSSLIRVNDYQQFSEVFEAAVHIGCESFWVTSTINVSGAYACCA